jgi:hypothetical protein
LVCCVLPFAVLFIGFWAWVLCRISAMSDYRNALLVCKWIKRDQDDDI